MTQLYRLFLSVCLVISFTTSANTDKPKIIALSPHIVEMLFDIGAGSQIIGTSSFADYPETAKSIPVVGTYARLQLEKIIALQPDIIFAWKSGNPSDDLARLKQLGFNIVYSQPNSFSDIAKELKQFAELTGHKQQGLAIAEAFEKKLKQIKQIYQHKTFISTFYELWSRPLTTVAQGSWPQQFLTICRAKNLFKQASAPYPQVSIEQVLANNVQLIIQPLSKNQSDRTAFNWQQWTTLDAVKHKQIIQPNADAMHRMTTRSLDELAKLCQKIDSSRQFYHKLAAK